MTSKVSVLRCIFWASVSSWYYGYHLSELNFPVASLTCSRGSSTFGLPDCLPVTDAHYSYVTAIYTLGGLCGSLSSSHVTHRYGVVGAIGLTGWINLVAAGVMGLSLHWIMLGLGRFIAGGASGIAICLVPPYLAQLAKASPNLSQRSGLIGSMHQLAIVIGLFTAQLVALLFTGERGDLPGRWRGIVALSGAVSVWQIWMKKRIGLPNVSVEEPGVSHDVEQDFEEGGPGSPMSTHSNDQSTEALIPSSSTAVSEQQLSLRAVLSSRTMRTPTLLCATIFALQQLSGVNAVIFYSTPVLKNLLPASAALIGLAVTGMNAVMTIPAMFLVDRVGRKRLLLWSVLAMGISSGLLAYGLNTERSVISALAIISFVASFAVGLGPIPFLFVSELVPQQAIPALSALALSLSWVSSFIIALLFLPLRDGLSSPDPTNPHGPRINEGRIFYIFVVNLGVLAAIVKRWLPNDN